MTRWDSRKDAVLWSTPSMSGTYSLVAWMWRVGDEISAMHNAVDVLYVDRRLP